MKYSLYVKDYEGEVTNLNGIAKDRLPMLDEIIVHNGQSYRVTEIYHDYRTGGIAVVANWVNDAELLNG